jgi:hypothetical membrane protein
MAQVSGIFLCLLGRADEIKDQKHTKIVVATFILFKLSFVSWASSNTDHTGMVTLKWTWRQVNEKYHTRVG